jgi:AraC-like DNA-binding protein
VRNIPIVDVDSLDRDLVAIGTDYPPEHLLTAHRHRRAQFLYAATGLMQVETLDGSWTIPTERAVLVPPGVDHEVTMHGVSTRSLYLEPAAVPWFPARCQVVDVTPLLRQLALEAVEMPARYAVRGRDGALVDLLLLELARATELPLELPLPVSQPLRGRCVDFARRPTIHSSPAEWAEALHLSTRGLTRAFQRETGMSFGRWRERACVLHALTLLAAGQPVTQVAATLGYDSPAAFSTMFRRLLGSPPNGYRASGR